ncbi:MAG TPA: DUF4397 domain-containing protein [Chitinophagaceae bacterium]|nr:DUF4397 domain-containing protein [Chitinophagaceae bacterium]
MKVTKILTACGSIVALAVAVISCTKTTGKEVAKEDNNFNNKTLVQVYNATIGSANTQVFVDGAPVTGSALAYGSVFPTAFAFRVDAGLRGFSIRNTAATSTQTPIIFSENMEVNKQYTIFTYDTSTAAKQITVLNNIVVPSDTSARVKFANFTWLKNGTAPGVDVYSVLKGGNVFTNVLPTQVTEYIPYPAAVADVLIVRETGTMNGLDTAAFNFTKKRSFTLIYRGRAAQNEAGGAASPRTLSSFANY